MGKFYENLITDYCEFLEIIDNLYLLAVDKNLFCDNSNNNGFIRYSLNKMSSYIIFS